MNAGIIKYYDLFPSTHFQLHHLKSSFVNEKALLNKQIRRNAKNNDYELNRNAYRWAQVDQRDNFLSSGTGKKCVTAKMRNMINRVISASSVSLCMVTRAFVLDAFCRVVTK